MKYQLVGLCALMVPGAFGGDVARAAPVVRMPNPACSTRGFTAPAPINRAPDAPVQCWSAQVTCPPNTQLLQNGTDLSGRPVTWIGYDAGQRAFFYTCAPVVRQPPPK